MPTNKQPSSKQPPSKQASGLQASHLADLRRHPGFQLLLAYLKDRQTTHLRQCQLLDPLANATELARRQGELRALRDFDDPALLLSRVADYLGEQNT